MIYLDNNATTQPLPEVIDAMSETLREHWYNPSATYKLSYRVQEKIEEARFHLAELIGASSQEIIFTSGGTESTNAVFRSWLNQAEKKEIALVVATQMEHPASLSTLKNLSLKHYDLVNLDASGQVNQACWNESLNRTGVVGASFCLANNETGVILHTDEMMATARALSLPIHADVVQAVGKMPLSLNALGVDYASISAHKFHGPKGVGALYVRRGKPFSPLIYGGGQEGGRRSGTENVPGIIGMGVAARLAKQYLQERMIEMKRLRDLFESLLMAGIPKIRINGEESPRLVNTSNIMFSGCPAEGLLLLLESKKLCVSVASACKAGQHAPSHVLTAMGLSEKEAKSSLRFSLSSLTNELEIRAAADIIISAVRKLRDVQSSQTGPVVIYRP